MGKKEGSDSVGKKVDMGPSPSTTKRNVCTAPPTPLNRSGDPMGKRRAGAPKAPGSRKHSIPADACFCTPCLEQTQQNYHQDDYDYNPYYQAHLVPTHFLRLLCSRCPLIIYQPGRSPDKEPRPGWHFAAPFL